MDAHYISSDILVSELINDYNIQSTDFIGRCGSWIVNALNELGIYQANTQLRQIDTFGIIYDKGTFTQGIIEFETDNVSGFELPYNCIGVIQLKLNGKLAHKKSKVNSVKNQVLQFKPMRIHDEIINKELDPSELFISLYNKNVMIAGDSVYEYAVNGNFVYTNIPNGTYELTYRGIPSIAINGFDYPYIMDNALLKKALKCYILKMMLMRGYIHPQLNLSNNNPFTNPALEFEQLRHRVRTSCNKYDVDERNNLSKPLNNF